MPALAPWRQHRENLARKGGYEANLLAENEVVFTEKRNVVSPSSPVTVVISHALPPELLELPGSWTVIGKKGRPLKSHELKMYDEPLSKSTKKKNKKKKNRRAESGRDDEGDGIAEYAALAETASSSKALEKHARSTDQHAKEVSRACEKKYWQRHHQTKLAKRDALGALLAALEDATIDDGDDDERESREQVKPGRRPARNFTPGAQKKRRATRLAAAAARCYSPEGIEAEAEAATANEGKPKASAPPPPPAAAKGKPPFHKPVRKPEGTRTVGSAPWKKQGTAGSATTEAADDLLPSDKRKAPDEAAQPSPGASPHAEPTRKQRKSEAKGKKKMKKESSSGSGCEVM